MTVFVYVVAAAVACVYALYVRARVRRPYLGCNEDVCAEDERAIRALSGQRSAADAGSVSDLFVGGAALGSVGNPAPAADVARNSTTGRAPVPYFQPFFHT